MTHASTAEQYEIVRGPEVDPLLGGLVVCKTQIIDTESKLGLLNTVGRLRRAAAQHDRQQMACLQ